MRIKPAITGFILCLSFLTSFNGIAPSQPSAQSQSVAPSQTATQPLFKVVAFYTARNDQAHISFVHEANRWFPQMAAKYDFSYDSTNDWTNMNTDFLSKYQVVLFLDTRPD